MATNPSYPQLHDEEWLREQYFEKGLSGGDISRMLGCHKSTVHEAMKRYGLVGRVGGHDGTIGKEYPKLQDRNWLYQEYITNQRTSRDLAAEIGCSTAIVLKALEFFEIAKRHNSMRYEPLKDRVWLEEQYIDKNRSGDDIAAEVGCTKHAVYRALNRYGIERRIHTNKAEMLKDKEWLEDAYVVQGLSLPQIAKIAGTTTGNIGSVLNAMGIRRRSAKEGVAARFPDGRMGEQASRWAGGRNQTKQGYILIYAPDHPSATKNGYVFEHRLVMEKMIGRYLEPYEVVHHDDGVKWHNDPSNLILKTTGKHTSDHFKAGHEATKLRKENEALRAELARLKAEPGR